MTDGQLTGRGVLWGGGSEKQQQCDWDEQGAMEHDA